MNLLLNLAAGIFFPASIILYYFFVFKPEHESKKNKAANDDTSFSEGDIYL